MESSDPIAEQVIATTTGFAHLSNVYRFTEQFGIMGHRIGRKVGDMLEVVTMACLWEDEETKKRIVTEPKVLGFTEAAHKVEFAFYNRSNKDACIGLVECKKVGVEVTKHSRTKDVPVNVRLGSTYSHTMRPDWVNNHQLLSLAYAKPGKVDVTVGGEIHEFEVKPHSRIKLIITEDGNYAALGPGAHLDSIVKNIGSCHIFTVQELDSQGITFSIDTCLTGPQTIEKAKQIAWVALDVRRRECKHWGKEDLTEAQRAFKAILVIGEASHWEVKSRKVVRAALDYNLIVADPILVELFKVFIAEFGQDKFEVMISKAKYAEDSVVRGLVDTIVTAKKKQILTDMDTGKPHRIIVRDDKLIVDPI